MREAQGVKAKIISHSEGLGVPSPELVRKRALELARINGRTEVSAEDWKEAKRELHGGHHDLDEEEDGGPYVSERDMVAASTGTHKEKIGFEDSGSVVEELVAEGLDEANHEQMLEGCKPREEDLIDGL